MFEEAPTQTYQHRVEGIWGEFLTTAGRVSYVLTKARLGTSGTDHERRLTQHLRPVREVLEVKGLDFNQLLQRDLDDHRVITDLVPYLLKPKSTGPAFFPPIVAVLLPFAGKQPVAEFPQCEDEVVTKEDSIFFNMRRFGPAFRVLRHAYESGQTHPIKLGRLEWNDEHSKLVVLDGQHRAMALLAIDRTIRKTWSQEGAGRYSHFYESRVRRILDEVKAELSLDGIEVPVAVCWFPDKTGPSGSPHHAARKLFVDVNKEARTPSEARLTLLSDAELLNVLTRGLLNRLRQESPPLPLFAVEYDNPERETARPVKWSVLTNLNFLKASVELCVFGPPKYVRNVKTKFGGRKSEPEMDTYMREQLDLKSLFPEHIEDGERIVDREEIGNKRFPGQHAEALTDRFMTSWGHAILALLGGLLPYKAHCEALIQLNDDWIDDDAIAGLAKEAMFEGVGMFWTLRSSNDYWLTQRLEAKRVGKPEPPKPEIVQAWDIIQAGGKKQEAFNALRSSAYLESASKKAVESSNAFFEVVCTNACQLGAVMALASLGWKTGTAPKDMGQFAEIVVAAWNSALIADVDAGSVKTRRLVFSKEVKNPINRIKKLDSPLSVYFRYFWLELLRTSAAMAVIGGSIEPAIIEELSADGRELYLFDYLIPEQEKTLERTTMKKSTAKKKARALESGLLKKALQTWFEYPSAEFDSWFEATSKKRDASGMAEDEGQADAEEAQSPADGEEALAELLGDLSEVD